MLVDLDEQAWPDVRSQQRARVLALLMAGTAQSRRDVAERTHLRSTSVSQIIADLADSGLVREDMQRPHGRGRPTLSLSYTASRFGVTTLQVTGQTFVASLVDLSGRVIHRAAREASTDHDNTALLSLIGTLTRETVAGKPRDMEHLGLICALPGIVDASRCLWITASRWPRMTSLSLKAIEGGAAPFVGLVRNLDAELEARLHRERTSESVLLFHWGYGISMSYAEGGRSVRDRSGPFGEIGHWQLESLAERRCHCGQAGCLEAGAAMWALLPELRKALPGLQADEEAFAAQAPALDLIGIPALARALRLVVRALVNLCRIFFPTRLLVSGPFTANPAVWREFVALFEAEEIMRGVARPSLQAVQASLDSELKGAVRPLLVQRVVDELIAPRPRA